MKGIGLADLDSGMPETIPVEFTATSAEAACTSSAHPATAEREWALCHDRTKARAVKVKLVVRWKGDGRGLKHLGKAPL